MATDTLSAPLGTDKPGKKPRRKLPLGWIGLGLGTLVLAVFGFWIVAVDNPLGGEPFAVVQIERQASGIKRQDVEVVNIRPTLPSADQAGGQDQPEDDESSRIEFTDQARGEPDGSAALSAAAVDKITETGPYGPLPKIAEDGSRPLDVYAAPVPRTAIDSPKIVLIVTGIGLSQTGTESALRELPPGVTLAIAPYGSSLDRWVRRARQAGHELLLQLPLEPFDFPDNDPGPHTLLTKLSPAQNLDRLHWLLSRATNYVGVVNYMGARFTAAHEPLTPLIEELAGRGLLFFDDGSSSRTLVPEIGGALGAPFLQADIAVDPVSTAEDIDSRLMQLESLGRSSGLAIGVATALPITIERIADWARGLEARGIYLVPPSYVARSGHT